MNHNITGVTLLELLITLAIASIIFLFGVPSANNLINKSRVTAAVNDTSALLQYSRYAAVSKYKKIILCPTSNSIECNLTDWQLPLFVFEDDNYNGKRDPQEKVLRRSSISDKYLMISGPKKRISFQRGGSLSSPATINICIENGDAKFSRALYVSLNGRIRLSKDTNGDGFHDNGFGKTVSC